VAEAKLGTCGGREEEGILGEKGSGQGTMRVPGGMERTKGRISIASESVKENRRWLVLEQRSAGI